MKQILCLTMSHHVSPAIFLNPKATVFRRCLGFRGAIKEEPWSFQLIRGSVYTMVQSADHFEKI